MQIATQVEFSYSSRGNVDRTFYVPSADEVRGYDADKRGDARLALAYFDDAIARDPTRGARVYATLTRAGSSLGHVYWSFFRAELERSVGRQAAAVDEVHERCAVRGRARPWLQQVVAWLEPPKRHKQA